MSSSSESNLRPEPDPELVAIADYVLRTDVGSDEAFDTARYCLMDSLGCAFLALQYPACRRHLGPIVPGTVVPNGVRVPGTPFELDPDQGRLRHRLHDSLARLQRHLAGGRVGPSVGQPGRHSRRR